MPLYKFQEISYNWSTKYSLRNWYTLQLYYLVTRYKFQSIPGLSQNAVSQIVWANIRLPAGGGGLPSFRLPGGGGPPASPCSIRLKSASLLNEGARALSGMGAARTATCVRKEIASRRDEMINIWGGLSKREVGWRPAWRPYWSRRDFIPETRSRPVSLYLVFYHQYDYVCHLCPRVTSFLTLQHQTFLAITFWHLLATRKSLFIYRLRACPSHPRTPLPLEIGISTGGSAQKCHSKPYQLVAEELQKKRYLIFVNRKK